jgi:hypothetical protein
MQFTEEYFPCKDLGTELKPIIERFQSKESKLRESSIVLPVAEPPIVANPAPGGFGEPVAFEPWIAEHIAQGPGAYALFQGREKAVNLIVGSTDVPFLKPKVEGSIHEKVDRKVEGVLLQCTGEATVRTAKREVVLSKGGMLLVTAEEQPARLVQCESSATLVIQNRAQLR